jgi:hypothetical protein
MSLSDAEESRVAIAFDQYLAALDAGQKDLLDAAAMDRTRHDVRVYRMLRNSMSHIEAVDEHDEGTFVTWSVRAVDGTPVARFSAIVSLRDDEDIVIDRLVSLAASVESILGAPLGRALFGRALRGASACVMARSFQGLTRLPLAPMCPSRTRWLRDGGVI